MIDPPHIGEDTWIERANWLTTVEEEAENDCATYHVSELADLLIHDIRRSHCSGAWVSVLVLCHAAIDATIRDVETGDYQSPSKKLVREDPDLEWLRNRRNSLVHVAEDSEEEIDIISEYHKTLETDAQRAVKLLFQKYYARPGSPYF